MSYLLDTDTFIYWMKDTPSVVSNILRSGLDTVAGSVISKAELFFGAFNSVQVEHNVKAVRKLARIVSFLPLDDLAQEFFGKIKAELRRSGLPLEDSDILIAATALSTHRILVTNNIRHFSRIPGLKIETWIS
jgi:tRNA(fMet)-specific endonuclease VapC